MNKQQFIFLLVAFSLMYIIYKAFWYNDSLYSAMALCRKVKAMDDMESSVENNQTKNEYLRQLDGLGYTCDGKKAVTKQ